MKKITTILMLLMLSMGVWAQTVINIGSGQGNFYNTEGNTVSGNFNAIKFVSNATPTVTLEADADHPTAFHSSDNRIGINNVVTTITISVPEGYQIKGYQFDAKAVNAGHPAKTFTPAGEDARNIPADATWRTYAVENVNAQSTSFTLASTAWSPINSRNFKVTVEKAAGADYTTEVEANIKPWIESIGNGYFTLDPNNTDVQALQTAYNSHTGDTWTEAGYNDLLALLTAAKASENAYIMPETGYYRLKSNGESNRPVGYIGYSQTTLPNYESRGIGLRNIAIEDAKTDASTILKLTKVEGGYTISTEGLYVMDNETQGRLFPVTDVAEDAAVFVPTVREDVPGQAFWGTATNSNHWGLHNSNWNAIVGWTNSEPSFWILENAAKLFGSGSNVDVLQLPLTEIDGKYYATTCLPFPAQIMEAYAEAYKVTLSGKKAVEELIGNKIPAFEPVLLISEVMDTLSIAIPGVTISGAEPEAVTGNQLKGVLVKTAQADLEGETPVVFNQVNGKAGFYKLAEGSSLSANRAYLSYVEGITPASVKAFFEEGFELGGNEATAIENIENGAFENGAVYNLQGQRVTKAQKGVFIQNGKKVVLK